VEGGDFAMIRLNRRRFVTLGSAALVGACAMRPGRMTRDPFTLGVASGEPAPDGFVIWTRLAPDPLNGGGMAPEPVELGWEVAADEGFRTVVARGKAVASPGWGHSVHVEVAGLQPGRWYWYRFDLPEARSPVGRARTVPAAAEGLRFAFSSCQRWEVGHYTALQHAAEANPDLFVHLGDYIYEYSLREGRNYIRTHDAGETVSLADYRNRYALYKSEPALKAAHAACPWLVTWDDHEVDNDYADDRPEDGMAKDDFLRRRAAAYQAYYEHMPLRPAQRPAGPNLTLYRTLRYGALATFHVLDDRQYRSPQACPRPGRSGGSSTVGPECTERLLPGRSLLGEKQEAWLREQLTASRSRWNILAQQTLMVPADWGGGRFWTDGWDGYPAARQRLVDVLATGRVSNPVVIGGDVHSFYAGDLHAKPEDPTSPVVAAEFIGGSISSLGLPQEQIDRMRPHNPHVKLARSDRRGYALAEIAAGRMSLRFQAVQDARVPASTVDTLASFVVEDRNPRLQLA